MADMMYNTTATGGDLSEDNSVDFYGGINNNLGRPRFPGLYVGNLTWWTTDQDVINSINSIGIKDVQEVKFFENRNNGQSKGFCVVTFGSEASLPIVMEKLPKLELYGQNPVVTPYNRQNLNLFEAQTKPRPQVNSANGPNSHGAGIMGISSISGVHAGTQGLPYSGMNSYNQAGGLSGPRAPSFHNHMRMPMRGPRPAMRGPMSNPIGNGAMAPGGHQMTRMPRFMQAQGWNNSQGSFNPANRMPQPGMDVSSRLSMGNKQDEVGIGQDMMSGGSGLQTYYTPHHPNSQSDHYRGDIRDHRDLREDRERDRDRDRERERDRDRDRDRERDLDRDRDSTRRLDDRPLRHDDRSLRHDDRSLRHDDRSRDERSLRHEERSTSRRDERSSRRDSSSRHDEGFSRKEEKSSRREEKSSRREKSHRSKSRDRSRSKDRKERRERKERY